MIFGVTLSLSLPENEIPAIIIGMLYAVTDEIHQSFVPFRSCSFGDWLADALGVIAGVLIISFLFTGKDEEE